MTRNLAVSVRARLLNMAKAEGSDFTQILVRYALERFLYRLSQSAYADHFLLKGALLFTLWYELPHRATRDCDLLGFGPSDQETIVGTFRAIAAVPVDDGIVFDPGSVRVEEIRKDAGYAGVRVVITGELAQARCKTQIDIGFGDAVIPGPVKATYPVLIEDFPAPRLRTYPTYTVAAEKLHAIVLLGMTNSRLKDYLDLFVLLDREHLNEKTLARAIAATFDRRRTPLSEGLPLGLSDEFASDVSRQVLWQAFLRKNDIEWRPLGGIVSAIRTRLQPSLIQAARLSSARRP